MLQISYVNTHCDKTVRFDLVDPEALFHHAACPVQQLFQLAQSEGSYLWDRKNGRHEPKGFSVVLSPLQLKSRLWQSCRYKGIKHISLQAML